MRTSLTAWFKPNGLARSAPACTQQSANPQGCAPSARWSKAVRKVVALRFRWHRAPRRAQPIDSFHPRDSADCPSYPTHRRSTMRCRQAAAAPPTTRQRFARAIALASRQTQGCRYATKAKFRRIGLSNDDRARVNHALHHHVIDCATIPAQGRAHRTSAAPRHWPNLSPQSANRATRLCAAAHQRARLLHQVVSDPQGHNRVHCRFTVDLLQCGDIKLAATDLARKAARTTTRVY